MNLTEKMEELESAEEFFDFFNLHYDPDKVKVWRLHILNRFRQYKEQIDNQYNDEPDELKIKRYAGGLAMAYSDITSGEKEMRLFHSVIQAGGCSCSGGCGEKMTLMGNMDE